MYRKTKYIAALLTFSVIMTGCQSSGENLAAKDYKALDYVELGEYTGLDVEQIQEQKELTEEEKEEAIRTALEDYAEDQDVTDRGAQDGDYLSMTYSCYLNGELVDESGDEEVEMQLGTYTFFDEEGEAQLVGTKAGDSRTVSFTESDGEEEYQYTYEINVVRVYQRVLPELSDELAKEQGYASAQTMETEVYENTLESINSDYRYSAKEELIQLAMNNSVINGYPQSLYDVTYEQLNISYQDFFGVSMDEIFDGDEESLKATVEDTLIQELIVEAIAEKENITVTEKELEEYKAAIVAMYDYADVSELEAEYDDTLMANSLLNEKVQDFLLSSANITYVSEEEYYASLYDYEDDSYTEDDFFGEVEGDDTFEDEL